MIREQRSRTTKHLMIVAVWYGMLVAAAVAASAQLCGFIDPDPSAGCLTAASYCSLDPDCTPIPTSLPPLEGGSPGDGWYAGRAGCGTKPAYLFFRKCCGKPLANGVCYVGG